MLLGNYYRPINNINSDVFTFVVVAVTTFTRALFLGTCFVCLFVDFPTYENILEHGQAKTMMATTTITTSTTTTATTPTTTPAITNNKQHTLLWLLSPQCRIYFNTFITTTKLTAVIAFVVLIIDVVVGIVIVVVAAAAVAVVVIVSALFIMFVDVFV